MDPDEFFDELQSDDGDGSQEMEFEEEEEEEAEATEEADDTYEEQRRRVRQEEQDQQQQLTQKITLSDEQRVIAKDVEDSPMSVLAVVGSAGTGKSVLIRYLRGKLSLKYKRDDLATTVFVITPTGISASNVQGRTLHSFFGMNTKDLEKNQPADLVRRIKQYNIDAYSRIKTARVIIVDEISMIEGPIMKPRLRYTRLRLMTRSPRSEHQQENMNWVTSVANFGMSFQK